MNQPKEDKKPSTIVSGFISLLIPGTGQYYAGRSLKEALGWYALPQLIAVVSDLTLQRSDPPFYVLTGMLIIAIHIVAMINAAWVAQKTQKPQRDSRRLPALSVVLPGLGQIMTGRNLRGIAWLLGFAALVSLLIIHGSNETEASISWSIIFVSLVVYSLLSGYDMYKVVNKQDN